MDRVEDDREVVRVALIHEAVAGGVDPERLRLQHHVGVEHLLIDILLEVERVRRDDGFTDHDIGVAEIGARFKSHLDAVTGVRFNRDRLHRLPGHAKRRVVLCHHVRAVRHGARGEQHCLRVDADFFPGLQVLRDDAGHRAVLIDDQVFALHFGEDLAALLPDHLHQSADRLFSRIVTGVGVVHAVPVKRIRHHALHGDTRVHHPLDVGAGRLNDALHELGIRAPGGVLHCLVKRLFSVETDHFLTLDIGADRVRAFDHVKLTADRWALFNRDRLHAHLSRGGGSGETGRAGADDHEICRVLSE